MSLYVIQNLDLSSSWYVRNQEALKTKLYLDNSSIGVKYLRYCPHDISGKPDDFPIYTKDQLPRYKL